MLQNFREPNCKVSIFNHNEGGKEINESKNYRTKEKKNVTKNVIYCKISKLKLYNKNQQTTIQFQRFKIDLEKPRPENPALNIKEIKM